MLAATLTILLEFLAIPGPATADTVLARQPTTEGYYRKGCHPSSRKTPGCLKDDVAAHEAKSDRAQAACHPDPTKSRICGARRSKAGEEPKLALREDPHAKATN